MAAQFSVKIFVENEEKYTKKRLRTLLYELIVIILLTGYFTIAFIYADTWNMTYSVILITFLSLILIGILQYFSTVKYIRKVRDFKIHINEVYAKYNAKQS